MNIRSFLVLSLVVACQLSFADETPAPAQAKPNLAGQTAFDLIHITDSTPTIPLKNGKVVPGSEQVDVDGKVLKRDRDYVIDNSRGVVYLMVPAGRSQSVRVSYRHDQSQPDTVQKQNFALGSMSGIGLNILGSEQRILLGMGMAERMSDGTVMTSNVYGMKNKFGFSKSGSVSGMVVVGEQQKSQSRSLMYQNGGSANPLEGKGQAILQSLQSGFLGGKITANYQNVTSKFNGFQSFRDAGMAENDVQALSKERGMKRYGLGMTDIGNKHTKLNFGMNSVEDGKNSINWKSVGFNSGGFNLGWDQENVGEKFTRFNDLANGDKAQLAQEAGTVRENLGFGWASKSLKAQFGAHKVEDNKGNAIFRREISLATNPFDFSFSDQKVEKGFTRFTATRMADFGQLAREQGLRRQNVSFNLKGTGMVPAISINQASLRPDEAKSGRFAYNDLKINQKLWSYRETSIGSNQGFSNLGNMSEPEIQNYVAGVNTMYVPVGIAANPIDRGMFLNGSGVTRKSRHAQLGFSKNANASWLDTSVQTPEGSAKVDSVAVSTPNSSASLKTTTIGSGFADNNRLLQVEKTSYGPISDFKRTDAAMDLNWGKKGKFAYSSTKAALKGEKAMDRTKLAYSKTGLEFFYNSRQIASGFDQVGALLDGERDLLTSLRGYSENDYLMRWTAYRGLSVEFARARAANLDDLASRMWGNTNILFSPDKSTNFAYQQNQQKSSDPTHVLSDHKYERWSLQREFGNFLKVQYENEKNQFSGEQKVAPSTEKEYYSLEAKINPKTSIKTEQTKLRYDDGGREDTQTKTISTSLSKNSGISFGDTKIDRDADKPDEHRHQVGFWYDFGKGMRLSYNLARQANTAGNGTEQNSISLTPGEIGGLAIGSAMYGENNVDRTRYQSTGNFQVSTQKPLQLGIFRDLTFRYGADTQRDQYRYMRENRVMGAGFRVGKTAFGWDYYSQLGANNVLAIDRTFHFTTDQNEKSKFRASLVYKLRTLPNDQQFMIRDYKFAYRPSKGFELSHQLQTNPEVPNGGVLLGSIPQASRANRWKADFQNGGNTNFALGWDELINDQAKTRSRMGSVSLTLHAKNPSPLVLTYGVEQNDLGGKRKTMHRYSLRYDQRPGPNQLMTLFLGNISWQHSRDAGSRLQNWSLRLEYQLKF